jgi:hypothetical protein
MAAVLNKFTISLEKQVNIEKSEKNPQLSPSEFVVQNLSDVGGKKVWNWCGYDKFKKLLDLSSELWAEFLRW